MEMEGGDMDSLFEGMVLFNPTQIEAAVENNQQDNNRVDDSQSDAAAAAASCSQPLDENIFSDLTLIVDPLQNLQV
ncbi:myosin-2 heavy chain-like, partial [Trifolium medium]|nr:myosin-2 heavy chain-like [Trifolium medium]